MVHATEPIRLAPASARRGAVQESNSSSWTLPYLVGMLKHRLEAYRKLRHGSSVWSRDYFKGAHVPLTQLVHCAPRKNLTSDRACAYIVRFEEQFKMGYCSV